MKKKHYSVSERKSYHEKRSHDQNEKETKIIYSQNWLDGFTDPHYEHNLKPIKRELAERKEYLKTYGNQMSKADQKQFKRSNNINFTAYINGATARLNQKNNN